jgi:hydrophobic/amphiphilic exporter-1 (mainly G- bacteria), HAE1 family
MTLMALSITVGILVTNTIVVLENIYRHLDRRRRPARCRAKGTSEIGVAVAASTLTNLVVFTPIAFMEGIIGQFFYAFGLTVVFATVFSIFISFTLAPLLAARLLRTNETETRGDRGLAGAGMARWDDGLPLARARQYRGALGLGAGAAAQRLGRHRHHLHALLVSLFVAAASSAASSSRPATRAPSSVEIELPSGTPLERTSEIALRAEQRIATLDGRRVDADHHLGRGRRLRWRSAAAPTRRDPGDAA